MKRSLKIPGIYKHFKGGYFMFIFEWDKSEKTRVCIVCHCYRESETVIRIISARKATKKEVQRYAEGI